VVFQQHLQPAMTHLPLNPVERLVLLERQDCEAVATLLTGGRCLPDVIPRPFSYRLRRAECVVGGFFDLAC
jgi:hypothetical protein